MIFLLVSCATTQKNINADRSIKVNVSYFKNVPLLPTENLFRPVHDVYELNVNLKEKRHSYIISLKADKTLVHIMFLNKEKGAMSEIRYDDKGIKLSDIDFPAGITSQEIIAQFQWCFYKVGDVAKVFSENGLRLAIETEHTSNKEIRRIYDKEKCIIEISNSPSLIRFIDHKKRHSYVLIPIR
ncbi:DUF3261 domain-containing protein [Treponema parvum]|uniref:DUF3261 domain-containing protein n=1 Tax=Treponema parvum TaxID=138851 RepID=UPI001AEBC347|nr:DUF3261 domain-containing protein [Treponema parvum]QTQ17252.1 DUF3261 domain-containing protein [Treponema parvum]